jgi:hypothetical protein
MRLIFATSIFDTNKCLFSVLSLIYLYIQCNIDIKYSLYYKISVTLAKKLFCPQILAQLVEISKLLPIAVNYDPHKLWNWDF